MKKKQKTKIRTFIDFVLNTKDKTLLGYEYNPKVRRKLRAFAVESKQPLGGNEYNHMLMQITEWSSGEGFDLSFSSKESEKMFSMTTNEIDLLLKGLQKMEYFKFDKDELKQ